MAQLLLTPDGLIITLSSSGLVQDILNMQEETSVGRRFLSPAVAVLLSFSVYCAVEALHGKLSDADLRQLHLSFGVTLGNVDSYNPRIAWWFGMIAAVSRSEAQAHHEAWRDSLAGSILGGALFWRGGRKSPDTSPPDPLPPDPLVVAMETYLLRMRADQERKALARAAKPMSHSDESCAMRSFPSSIGQKLKVTSPRMREPEPWSLVTGGGYLISRSSPSRGPAAAWKSMFASNPGGIESNVALAQSK